MKKEKIKVVWLCHFSNTFVHGKLDLRYNWLMKIMRKMARKPVSYDVPEFANWVSNGIKEFEKFNDVELHVVSPYPHLMKSEQEFTSNGIYYHFFRNEDDRPLIFLYKKLFRPYYWHYRSNRRSVASFIDKIHPDVVHLFGAENPDYSLSLLDVPKDVITIAQLQTLMNDPDFRMNYHLEEKVYQYRVGVEREIIENVDYLGTPAEKYRIIILNQIRPNARILNIGLALRDPIVREETAKEFDFVYFSADLCKAADLALEAFGLAFQKDSSLTLDIIGGYDAKYKHLLERIIHRYGMEQAIRFEGKLPTHNDVLRQIRKSKYALLPLRIDLTSGTIREAMSNGLPVITTDTGELGTQKLNAVKQCALITPVGDHQAMADSILHLIKDNKLADTLRQNSFETRLIGRTNEETSRRYVEAYNACLISKKYGIAIPEELTRI